jgi:integrase
MELKKKDDGYWHVGYQTDDGFRWKNTQATTKDEAEEVCKLAKIAELEMAAKAANLTAEVLSSIVAGRRVTCAHVLAEWTEWRVRLKAPATAQTQAYTVSDFLTQSNLYDKLINRVDSDHIEAYVNAADAGTRGNRSSRLAALRSYFNYASAKTYIVGNPSKIVSVNHRILSHEQKESKVRVPFTLGEFRKIMSEAEGFYRWATALSYWTGLRISDIANLEWSSLQPGEIVVWTKKRDARVALPTNDPLIGGGELNIIIMEIMDAVPKKGRTSKLIFPDEAGWSNDPNQKSKLSTYYGRMLARIGIEDKTFHCLRHSFASRLKAAGKTEEEIGRLIGHSNTETTKGYIHT